MRLHAPLTAPLAMALLLGCGGGGPDEGGQPEAGVREPADTAAASDPPDTATPAPAGVSGGAVYAANCATCHGESGTGDGPAAVGLEPPPADMTDSQWTTGDGSLAAIRNTVANGSPGTAMIAWKGTLTDAEIEAVSRHVQALGPGGGR